MITVAKLAPADKDAWEALFRQYVAFYGQDHQQSMYDRAWSEFQADTRMHALGAWVDGTLAGITHFLVHPSTTDADVCYLEDLFTAHECRGRGVARALIEAVADWAAEHGCCRVYWLTHELNATARLLYDKVADDTGFVMYSLDLPGHLLHVRAEISAAREERTAGQRGLRRRRNAARFPLAAGLLTVRTAS